MYLLLAQIMANRRNNTNCSCVNMLNAYQVVFPVDGVSANHTDEVALADNEADTTNENMPDENDSDAGDEDSEDDDDIQVTIGDIKTNFESVLMFWSRTVFVQFICSSTSI